MKERKLKEAVGKKQNFEIWANWLKTDNERERGGEMEREAGGGTYCEAEITCFLFFFFLFWDSYGCSSLWYMGQAGGETLSGRATRGRERETEIQYLKLCFAFLSWRPSQNQQIDLTVVLKCWQSATWDESKRKTEEEGGEEEDEPELAPHTALSIYII